MKKIIVGEDVDNKLRALKGRTGLAPNILCRIGLCLSLDEPGIPDIEEYSGGNGREFNRYTLTGEYDSLFFALVRQRLHDDGLDVEDKLEEQFKAHLSRGVMILTKRAKSLNQLLQLASG